MLFRKKYIVQNTLTCGPMSLTFDSLVDFIYQMIYSWILATSSSQYPENSILPCKRVLTLLAVKLLNYIS